MPPEAALAVVAAVCVFVDVTVFVDAGSHVRSKFALKAVVCLLDGVLRVFMGDDDVALSAESGIDLEVPWGGASLWRRTRDKPFTSATVAETLTNSVA